MTDSTTLRALDHESERIRRGLASAVEGALWAFEPLRTTKARVAVSADAAGRVTLAGNVRSEMMRDMAGRLAARVPGATSVENELITDPSLEAQAAVALSDAGTVRLFTDQVEVESRLGTMYLGGRVVTADEAGARATIDAAILRIELLTGVHELFDRTQVIAGAASGTAAAESIAPAAAGGADQAAIQERLRVWKERVGQTA